MRSLRRMIVPIASIAVLTSSTVANAENLKVTLTIVRDGQPIPPPEHMTIAVAGEKTEVPIVKGTFEVPAPAVGAERADLGLDFGGEEIRIPSVHSTMFKYSQWTLLMADKSYAEGYQSEMLPGADIRQTCILHFSGPDFEDLITVVDQCRTKVKLPKK